MQPVIYFLSKDQRLLKIKIHTVSASFSCPAIVLLSASCRRKLWRDPASVSSHQHSRNGKDSEACLLQQKHHYNLQKGKKRASQHHLTINNHLQWKLIRFQPYGDTTLSAPKITPKQMLAISKTQNEIWREDPHIFVRCEKGLCKEILNLEKNYIYTFSKLILFSYTTAFTLIKEVPM